MKVFPGASQLPPSPSRGGDQTRDADSEEQAGVGRGFEETAHATRVAKSFGRSATEIPYDFIPYLSIEILAD